LVPVAAQPFAPSEEICAVALALAPAIMTPMHTAWQNCFLEIVISSPGNW
jgi:L-ascorbate metabolism protein UlaG (beta-lactamase superfamily)